MKLTIAFIFALLLGTHCQAIGESPRSRQWIELALVDGPAWLDLAQATEIYVGGDRVIVRQRRYPDDATYMFEDNAAAAQVVLKAAQAAPERWLRVNTEVEYYGDGFTFVNFEAVAAVYFRTDEKGAYALVFLREQSVLGANSTGKNWAAGYRVRIPADIEHLKSLFSSH